MKLQIEKRADEFKSRTRELMSTISTLENQLFRSRREETARERRIENTKHERQPRIPKILGISLPWLAGSFKISRWRVFIVAMIYFVVNVLPSLRSRRLSGGSTMYR